MAELVSQLQGLSLSRSLAAPQQCALREWEDAARQRGQTSGHPHLSHRSRPLVTVMRWVAAPGWRKRVMMATRTALALGSAARYSALEFLGYRRWYDGKKLSSYFCDEAS